ncbi:nitroreductase family protein [Rhizobium sp. CFBP 8762]|uniref:nitroreductase family protein n=1 Tax=Rhizobium sp. CFBP 8762 TaxID=2775279 RepID=UPI00177C810A|nr:nitroreductase family protein [Rhizobium sp. CFBP 8762]MBD8553374.1 nitroreductase family protein [Rhizobium sp. CFBP 8762]
MVANILKALETRFSANAFDPSTICEADIRELVRLACTAPTAFNMQNWQFIAVLSAGAKERLQAVSFGQEKIGQAAVVFILCGTLPDHRLLYDRLLPSVEAGQITEAAAQNWVVAAERFYAGEATLQRDEAVRSASFAAFALMLAAQAKGLGSCPIVGFEAERVAQEFGLTSDNIPVLLVAVGYPAGPDRQKTRLPAETILTIL